MPQTAQTFKNHTRFYPPFHFFVVPVFLITFLNSIRHLYLEPTISTGWTVVEAAALLTFALIARAMVLTVQDRVIRLEMRYRMKEILPSDLHRRINELTPRQLVALRFASDEEMPELVREVLAGSITTQKAIKERVKDWQGDYLRC